MARRPSSASLGTMSGRSGYRKTARKNPRKPIVVIRNAPPVVPGLPPDPPSSTYPVRLTFLLPDTILTSPGPHGFNTAVLPGNVVRIRGREAKHCFALAREYCAVVAWDRPAFICRGRWRSEERPRLRSFAPHARRARAAPRVNGNTAAFVIAREPASSARRWRWC
jgi:hypothetical protein